MGRMLGRQHQTAVRSAVKCHRGNRLTPPLELRTLGRLELVRAGESLLPGRRKLLMLLGYLALRDGRSTGRAELAQRFWSESDEARARQSLRQALSELREITGEALEVSDEEVRLRPGLVLVDVTQFEQASDRGELLAAEALWKGDFLDGAEVRGGVELRGWLEPVRERLRRRRARVGEQLVQAAADRGTWDVALQHAERWATALPLDRDARRRTAELQELAQRRRSSPGGIALLTPDLVGRSQEFARMTSAWAQVQAQKSRVILIEGDEGTGKSRLVQEFVRGIRQQRPAVTIVEVRAWEAERHESLVLARHLLAPLAAAPGVAAAPPSALRAIAAVAPEFSERYSALPAATPDRLPEAVARLLTETSAESPVLLVVDDAHFADTESRDLLEGLCRRPVAGVLLILTAAPGSVTLPDEAVRLRLAPLDREDLERMLASMAEFRPDDRAQLAGRLLEETGGNPLMSVELITALTDAGQLAPAPDGTWIAELPESGQPLPMTGSLRDHLVARIRQLSAPARALLDRCAVLGRQATIALVRERSGLKEVEFDTALDELVRSRLLRPPVTGDQLEFTHAAARQLVYDGLTPSRRQQLLRERGGQRKRWTMWLAGAAALLAIGFAFSAWRTPPIPATGAITVRVQPVVADSGVVPVDLLLAARDALAAALDRGTAITVIAADDPATATLEVEARMQLTGAGLTLSAQVRRAGEATSLADGTADGAAVELPVTAAALADRLFPERLTTAPFAFSSAQSRSGAALRKYFAGLQLSQSGQMEGAAQQFWLATRDDTTFVAAWHQLSRINAWFTLSDRSRRMADLAVARATGLTQHDLMLLQGWQQFAHGNAEEAEAHFRQVLGFSPDNQEATIGLAEVLYHHAWRRGRDPAASLSLWEAAAAANPEDWRPESHRWELALRAGELTKAARLLRASLDRTSNSNGTTRLLLAQLEGDTAGIVQRIAALPDDNEWAINHLAYVEATLAGRIDLARACLQRLTDARHSAEVQAGALGELAQLALAEGRWREAHALVARARILEPVSAAITEATLWVAPFLPATLADTGRPAVRARFSRQILRPIRRTRLFSLDYDNQRAPLGRWYLTALLAPSSSSSSAPALTDMMADSVTSLTALLERSVAARVALDRGDRAEAEALMATAWSGVEAAESEMSILQARPWDHFLRAMLLEARGSDEEAAQWFASAGTLSIGVLPYRAPAALHQGRLLERLGRPHEALEAYRRVLRLWVSADPEFQPMVTEARERVKALGGGPG